MASTLIETININADDFTDNFLTCPTCIGPYDESEHAPKLLPCSHTLCRMCLERISSSATSVNSLNLNNSNGVGVSQTQANSQLNSISRSVAAADAAHAALNGSSSTSNGQSPYLASNILYHLSNSSSLSTSTINTLANTNNLTDSYFRCPICREAVILPRGGVSNFPPSFIVNQLLDLIKNQRRDYVPLCKNHPNEELLFCETCDAAFCSLCESHCRVSSNADHIVIPFSIAIKRMSEIFFFKSNQCINSFNLALANVQREIECLNLTVENVAQSIDYSFNELKVVVEKRREDLLKNLCKIKDAKTKLLTEQVQLIMNEKQKVELECKEYHQSISNIECKRLGAQIQQINEKLDCLRSLCEPRENCFINYEYKFNNVIENVEGVLANFGKFRTSCTYPPLCYATIRDLNNESTTVNTSINSSISSTTYSANLAILIQIQTVDYYGKKRTEGGDPINVIITDPFGRQEKCLINDLNNGLYNFKLIPSSIGKYRIDINIFSRPINQMPLFLNTVEYIDSLWTFGGGFCGIGSSNANLNSTNTTNQVNGNINNTIRNNLMSKSFGNNRGSTDRDFNMPISVRCCQKLIYVLDSGNNRIKVLNLNGNFLRHINHYGLNESSSTALALLQNESESVIQLICLNWRLKLLSNYKIEFHENNNKESLTTYELKDSFEEPIGLMETFHPDIFIIQDKKKLCLCTCTGVLMFESLDTKLKTECGLKNVTAFCANLSKPILYVADSSSNTGSTIHEVSLNWLCDNQLYKLIEQFKLKDMGINSFIDNDFTYKKFSHNLSNLSSINSTSQTSLVSNASFNSVATSSTTSTLSTSNNTFNSITSGKSGNSSTNGGVYTALCFDSFTNKILASKCDKQKTVIEIFNSNCLHEYSIESSQNEKNLKRVTSMSCTADGRVVCVDLCGNLIKMFRFI